MDFIDRLREISARIPKLKQEGLIKTEEGTKNALVMPFINALVHHHERYCDSGRCMLRPHNGLRRLTDGCVNMH